LKAINSAGLRALVLGAGEFHHASRREKCPPMGRREPMPNAAGDERDPVTETIAIFSDRLRNPLTVISAQVAMLLDGDYGSVSPEQHKALEVVKRNDNRLLQVIQDAEQSLARSLANLEDHQPPASQEPTPNPTSSGR
jgi:signal transduction histidine kinase